MPELPEVETVKKTLENLVLGCKITDVSVYWDNIIASDLNAFQSISGQTINRMNRVGKILVFEMDDYALIVHLRMEGKFYIKNRLDERIKHEHVVFQFEDGEQLRYHDTRKFGKMHLLPLSDYQNYPPISELGYEPFDESCTADYLYKAIKNKTIPIKQALLDQHIMAGLGNIYVNEVLFMSALKPSKSCGRITKKKCKEIIENSVIVLNKAISLGGTTIRSYYAADGVHGLFQNELLVHGKEGELCPVCGSEILKVKVNKRGTYYCPQCQK